MIENDDPGDSGFTSHTVRRFGFRFRRPKVDVHEHIDRLRFMGLDPAFVREAEARLRANPRRGLRWIEEQLKEFESPRDPPACGECGEPLVDAGWRGRATIHCQVCGSRWGVDVKSEDSEATWQIDGPSDEWRAAHPPECHDQYGDLQPEDVLVAGVPALPSSIQPGTAFPVAVWQDDRHAAVLYVYRHERDEFDLPGDEYGHEIEHLVLVDDGTWGNPGSGGGGWVNVFDPPYDLLDKYVVLGTGTSGSSDGDEMIHCTGGLCSAAVAAVEVDDRTGTHRYDVDRAHPFFVVGVYGRGHVRILDAAGETATGYRGERLELDIGE